MILSACRWYRHVIDPDLSWGTQKPVQAMRVTNRNRQNKMTSCMGAAAPVTQNGNPPRPPSYSSLVTTLSYRLTVTLVRPIVRTEPSDHLKMTRLSGTQKNGGT